MPSDKAVARYPHLASKRIVQPSSPLPQPSVLITWEEDIDDIIRRDRAYYGSDDLPPYIETRWAKNSLERDDASFTADAVDEHGIETGATIQVFGREWDELHRYWVTELDRKLHIVKRGKNNNKGFQLRLWLGHKRGFGRVVGHGISKKDDGGPKELISLDGASEKRIPCQHSNFFPLQHRLTWSHSSQAKGKTSQLVSERKKTYTQFGATFTTGFRPSQEPNSALLGRIQ